MTQNRCALGCLLIGLAATPAQSCAPNPDQVYETEATQGVAILSAKVTSFAFLHEGAQSCLNLEYQTQNVLVGVVPANFELTTCFGDAKGLEGVGPFSDAFKTLGFESGAEILVGFVTDPQSKELRYMIPGCWGPLHLSLNVLSDQDRADLLQSVTETFKSDTKP